jgi:hypothetical protein
MTASSALLLSIFPVEVEAPRLHNGCVNYIHPAARKDKILVRTFSTDVLSTIGRYSENLPFYQDETRDAELGKGYVLLRVWDTFIWTRDFTSEQERFMPHPMAASTVADDLCRHWTSDVIRPNAAFGPGLKVIRTETPTVEDLAELHATQEGYFRSLINDAHSKHTRGEIKDITDLHRTAAKWMGANNLPWVPRIEEVELKTCRACGNQIRSVALRCEHCNVDLPDFYKRYGLEVDELQDPVLFAVMQRMANNPRGAAAMRQ